MVSQDSTHMSQEEKKHMKDIGEKNCSIIKFHRLSTGVWTERRKHMTEHGRKNYLNMGTTR